MAAFAKRLATAIGPPAIGEAAFAAKRDSSAQNSSHVGDNQLPGWQACQSKTWPARVPPSGIPSTRIIIPTRVAMGWLPKVARDAGAISCSIPVVDSTRGGRRGVKQRRQYPANWWKRRWPQGVKGAGQIVCDADVHK
jgi:hypothetical protein